MVNDENLLRSVAADKPEAKLFSDGHHEIVVREIRYAVWQGRGGLLVYPFQVNVECSGQARLVDDGPIQAEGLGKDIEADAPHIIYEARTLAHWRRRDAERNIRFIRFRLA
jgi:hypothetical protein